MARRLKTLADINNEVEVERKPEMERQEFTKHIQDRNH